MLKSVLLSLSLVGFALSSNSHGKEKIRVSVPQFTNRSAIGDMHDGSACYGWSWFRSELGQAFQERLIADVLRNGNYEVLERETLDHIRNNEINLKNAERTPKIEKGKLRRAQYTLVGAVTSFEYCDGGSSGGVNVGSLLGFGDMGISATVRSAQVEVEIRAIDTTTGKVIASSQGKGNESSTCLGMNGLVKGVSLKGSHFKNSVLGKAIDRAITEASKELMEKVGATARE